MLDDLKQIPGKWNAYYMMYSVTDDYFRPYYLNTCGDKDDVVFQSRAGLLDDFCHIDLRKVSAISDNLYHALKKNKRKYDLGFNCKKETISKLLGSYFQAKESDIYDFFVKQGALIDIVNVDEYLHNDFDDKFIIRALRAACNSFFEYPIDAWAECWERFYLDVSKSTFLFEGADYV